MPHEELALVAEEALILEKSPMMFFSLGEVAWVPSLDLSVSELPLGLRLLNQRGNIGQKTFSYRRQITIK